MNKMRAGFSLIFVSLSFMALTSPSLADETQAVLTVDQAIEMAFQNSLLRKLALGEVSIAHDKKLQAASGYLPKVTLNGGASRFNEVPTSVELGTKLAQLNNALDQLADYWRATNPGNPLYESFANGLFQAELPDDSLFYYGLKLTIEQPLYTGNKLTALNKLAKANEDMAEANLEAADQNLVFEVKKGYYTVLQTQRIVETLRDAVRSMEAHVKEADSYYKAGMVPKLDVMRAEVKLADLKQKLVMAENGFSLAKTALNFVIGVDLGVNYQLVDDLKSQPLVKDLPTYQLEAVANRPELQSIKEKVKMAKQGIEIAKSGRKPVVALRAEGDNTKPYSSIPSRSVSLVASMKLYDGGMVANQIAETEDTLQQALIGQDLLERKIKLEVEQAYYNLVTSLRTIEVAQKVLTQAEETVKMADISYQAGLSTSLERIDAEAGLTQAKSNYAQALSFYNIAWAQLEKAIGTKREELQNENGR